MPADADSAWTADSIGLPERHDIRRLDRGSCRLVSQSGLLLRFREGVPDSPSPTLARHLQILGKRAIDVIFSIVALVFLSPLLIVVAVVIKLTSKGGILFCQSRDGLDGRPLQIYKFRSMYVDLGDISGVTQTTKGDPRVTPIGRFIRRTSIDELPQLLNVLKGDMSLVGPRPHPIGMLAGGKRYDELVPYYHLRHCAMKPGISGWAQVNGLRGATSDPVSARLRIDHDLAYIQNFSLWLDVKIVALTIMREFLRGSGD